MGDALLAAPSSEERITGFGVLSELGAAAAPTVRRLLDSPVAGHAALFLLDHGLATDDDVGSFVNVAPLVDLMATLRHEPDELCALFATSIPAERTAAMLDEMWCHDQPETILVLELLGRHLPDKPLAKAARRAAVKHRSWIANRRR